MDVAIRPFRRSLQPDMISGLLTLSAALVLAAPAAGAPGEAPHGAGPFEAEYLHSLSTNFGKVPLSDVALSYDPVHREVYVTGDGPIRVFNDSGMEVFTFRDSPDLAAAGAIAAMEDGDLVALVRRAGGWALLRCTFRGEVMAEIVPRNVPEPYANLAPGHMRYANRKIYLSDDNAMRILVLDDTGEYLASYDVAEKLESADNRGDLGMRGFGVDGEGNMLFTVQPLFRAFVMTPAGEVQGFGVRGGAPGKFNVVGGIARDAAGNYYVADLLKSAILVFDREFRFVKEFGYRGVRPGALAAPEEIVVGGEKLFVSNRGRKGVSVFHVGGR
jgi:hypothetical protein